MHGLDSELGKEPKRKQVQVSVNKAVQSEFGCSVFACLVVYHLFTDFLESGILCQIRDITVHLTIDFNMFNDLFAIGLQSAVKIVQILDARDFACSGVE